MSLAFSIPNLYDDFFPLVSKKAFLIGLLFPSLSLKGYDLYNHRNGKYLNTDVTIMEDEKQVTVATRDIQPGEQIYNSFNQCAGCEGRRVGYGTAGTDNTLHCHV